MSLSKIRVRVEDFRAIKKSDIIIDGITVVAGENGSGKSTLSKLLYYLYRTATNYESLVISELQGSLSKIIHFLEILVHDLPNPSVERSKRNDLRFELGLLTRSEQISLNEFEKNWELTLEMAIAVYNQATIDQGENNRINSRLNRIRYIIQDIIKSEEPENDSIPFNKIQQYVKSLFKEAQGKIQSRPISIFNEALSDVFHNEGLPKVFEVLEFEELIISPTKNHLSIPYSIQQAIYIDTPLSLDNDSFDREWWDDLNRLLLIKNKYSFNNLSKIIDDDIISGNISIEESSPSFGKFIYNRNDGKNFDLLDCATGLKAFAIIKLLLENGSLNDKTLMIIDEPESNLHPQWIIEYARLIVQLNKTIGIKFFIASHNPDMVSAIKHLSEKEGIIGNLNFYLAEKTDEKFLYNYRALGQDIDPIFASFNIALDRITKYSS